jgi:DNA-binding GntR family transcriptional regulator
MDAKVSAQTVQSQTVRKMREAILSGQFQPGDRLVEIDMCTRLGVSRPSLREALRSLEAEKLVAIVPNKGPMIPILSVEEAKDIYGVRALLEGEAVALFTQRATKGEVEKVAKALAMFERAAKEGVAYSLVESAEAFYAPILAGCGNNVIRDMLGSLSARVTFLRAKSMSLKGRPRKSAGEMRAIFKGIATGEAEIARMAAVEHVHHASNAALVAYAASASTK